MGVLCLEDLEGVHKKYDKRLCIAILTFSYVPENIMFLGDIKNNFFSH